MYVEWGTKIIYVYKIDMTLVQAAPTEIYALDLNWFRLQLKDLEDDEEGMMFLDTHSHNPPLDVGGVTLARSVEIINNYTVTFEDDQYAVNLVGANSNVGDRVNVNQVSVRSANSAGLVTSAAIEFGEYGAAVTVDVLGGESGTIYPIGTLRRPVDNFQDAMLIANARGFSKINLISDTTFTTGDQVSNMSISGINAVQTHVVVESGAIVINCEFRSMTLSGVLDGGNLLWDCSIGSLNYVNGEMHHCKLDNTIVLGGGADAHIHNCYSGLPGTETPIIDMGGSGQSLGLREYSGGVKLINLSSALDNASFDITAGEVILDSTVTAGNVFIRGVCKVTNNAADAVVLDMDAVTIPESVYTAVYIDIVDGEVYDRYPGGLSTYPVDGNASAVAIASLYNLHKFLLRGTLVTDRDYIGYSFEGRGTISENIVVMIGNDFEGTDFNRLTVTGTAANSDVQFEDCIISNVAGISGVIVDSGIVGTLTPSGDILCRGISFVGTTVIDFSAAPTAMCTMQIDAGAVQIENLSATNSVRLSQSLGRVILAASCTGGSIEVSGDAVIVDNSGGAVSILDRTTPNTVVDGVWDELLSNHAVPGSMGEALAFIKTVEGGTWEIVGTQLIFYDETSAEVARWNLYDSNGTPSAVNPYKKERI